MQILSLSYNKAEIAQKVHTIIDKYADRGLRSLAVARQVFFNNFQYYEYLILFYIYVQFMLKYLSCI